MMCASRAFKLLWVVLLVICASCIADPVHSDDTNESRNSISSDSSENTTRKITLLRTVDEFQHLSKKRCSRFYSIECLKVDMISMIDRMGKNTNLNIVSGISVNGDSSKYMSSQRSLYAKNRSLFSEEKGLDELLVEKVMDYIRSLSLNINFFTGSGRSSKTIGESFLDSIFRSEGRADKKGPVSKIGGALTTAAMISGAALLWMGLTTIAAIAGKALATAMLSIIIACFTFYKSSGSTHKSTTYEIVAKPVYSHAHLAADIPHDAHTAASGAGFGRNIQGAPEWEKNTPISIVAPRSERGAGGGGLPIAFPAVPIREDSQDMVYRAHVRPIYKRQTPITTHLRKTQ